MCYNTPAQKKYKKENSNESSKTDAVHSARTAHARLVPCYRHLGRRKQCAHSARMEQLLGNCTKRQHAYRTHPGRGRDSAQLLLALRRHGKERSCPHRQKRRHDLVQRVCRQSIDRQLHGSERIQSDRNRT